MTSAKLLLVAFFATSLLATSVLSYTVFGGHSYGRDYITQCSRRCYINPDGSTADSYKCPPGCGCISNDYNLGVYTGEGTCWQSLT
uniref:Putative secreted protein n=1 Tax=Amblyomma americanum TaxID=6943 RepID=A0A0C9S3C1_AMBAM